MKRPAGFEHQAESTRGPKRAAESPEPRGSSARVKPPRDQGEPEATPPKVTAGWRERGANRNHASEPFDASDTTTEPIVLSGGAAAVPLESIPLPNTAAPNTAAPSTAAPSTAPARAPSPIRGRLPAMSKRGGTAGSRAARSVLRAAQRARKRFERAEVRRFTGRSRRRRTAWILGVGSIVLAFALIIGAAYSPLMALRTIEVVGTSRIPATDVSAALADQLGIPLPLIDPDLVKDELSQFTLIQSYVTESRPPHTLVVRIVERVPVGVIVGPAGFDLVDAAGIVIETNPERPAGYPLIEAPDGIISAGFEAAAAVLTVLPESIRAQLDSVTAVTTDDVTLSLLGGEQVVWGSPEQSEYKAVVLAALLIGNPAGTVNEYDVSSPDSAVLR